MVTIIWTRSLPHAQPMAVFATLGLLHLHILTTHSDTSTSVPPHKTLFQIHQLDFLGRHTGNFLYNVCISGSY